MLGGESVGVLVWIGQIVAFLAVWKVAHLLFWNLRKMTGFTSLFVAMAATLLIALAAVALLRAVDDSWAKVLLAALIVGVANGEYEYNRGMHSS